MKLTFALVLSARLLPAAGRVAQGFGITLTYDAADFPAHSWTQEPKLTMQEIGTDLPEGVAPAHAVLLLTGATGSRRDPQDNRIAFLPLSDPPSLISPKPIPACSPPPPNCVPCSPPTVYPRCASSTPPTPSSSTANTPFALA